MSQIHACRSERKGLQGEGRAFPALGSVGRGAVFWGGGGGLLGKGSVSKRNGRGWVLCSGAMVGWGRRLPHVPFATSPILFTQSTPWGNLIIFTPRGLDWPSLELLSL